MPADQRRVHGRPVLGKALQTVHRVRVAVHPAPFALISHDTHSRICLMQRAAGRFVRPLHGAPQGKRGRRESRSSTNLGYTRTGLAPVDPAAYPEWEGKLTRAREASLRETPPASPPRGTNGMRGIIQRLHGVEYTRGGAIKLMHRLGFGYVRPKPLPRQADRAAQEAFMRKYGRTVRDAPPDGATVFADAVHPEWQSRPAHGREMYGWQRLVDSFLPKPGEFRVIATRCDRTAASFAARIHPVADVMAAS